MKEPSWHSMSLKSLFSELSTKDSGLTEKAANARLANYGKNQIEEIKKDPWYMMLLGQFNNLPIILLIAAAAISFALGMTVDEKKIIDGIAITVAILLAVFFSFFQEYKAERALEALKKLMVPRSVVLRGGKEVSIDSRFIVPGDILVLEEGSRVAADVRLIEAVNIASDQSTLTGESRPSAKDACTVPSKKVLSEQNNMLFAGTVIVRGHGLGVVVRTGMHTEFGKIVGYVTEKKPKETTLQKSLADLAKNLGYAGIILAALFFAIGIFRGETAANMFIVAVALAVAVIPEGLPTVLAITLAIGVQKMAKKNAIVRKMPAVETLGSATVICTDKTGTITKNKMQVQQIILADRTYSIGYGKLSPSAAKRDKVLAKALEIMALCNNAMVVREEGKETVSGDPTETALLSAVGSCSVNARRMRSGHRLVGEVPFDSGRKMMSSVRLFGKKRIALVKGAPEKIISKCSKMLDSKGEQRLTQVKKRMLNMDSQMLGEDGMRVLALAYRQVPKLSKHTASNTEKSLVFVGLVAMEDPPREEVPEAISLCRSAGIRVVMITGDSLQTAKAIASKVGLFEKGSMVVDGSELKSMDDTELDSILYSTTVFARVTPEQKYRIVRAFMRQGEIVAVTGDGVNDAPAIKKAHIGVAMGVVGTDVTSEVSDIVLTDDNFSSIVNAVKYGRTIFNNIKSFVRYQISTNVAAISLMFAAPALSLPLPLLPLQLLWINIMIDGPPALALGAEPPSKDEMKRPPRDQKKPFIGRNLVLSITSLGLLMASIGLVVFVFYLSYSPERAFTVVFTLFVFLQLFNALNCRSATESIFSRFFANPYVFLAILVSLLLHLAIVYYAPLQEVFKTVPLVPGDFAIIIAAALLVIVFEEIKKKIMPFTTAY